MGISNSALARTGQLFALLAGVSGLAISAPAMAQDPPNSASSASDRTADEADGQQDNGILEQPDADGKAIVVTGSRIARRDYQASSPIVTVGENLFDQSATASVESNLNKLPQFTPDKTPTLGGDIQPTARNTPGSATVSLRGIGANRSLVLIDGRRATPSNASMVVDINTIPAEAIQRVEIISGGASSTYGADAVGGVVNFILKKNFSGFQVDGRLGVTEHGDNFEYQVGGIAGADFADGRGNVSVSFSMNERKGARQRDRSWYRGIWADPSIGGTQIFPPFGGFTTGFGNLPDPTVLNSVIDGATFTAPPRNTVIYSDFNGNAFSGFDVGGIPGASGFTQNIDNYKYKLLNNGQIGVNDTDAYLIFPLTRYNIYARTNYEINDWIGAFAQGYFSSVSTRTQQQPAVITGGFSASLDPTINRAVIPAEILTILDSRPSPNAPFTLRAYLPFPRASQTDVNTYNITAGLQGNIPGSDWTYEVFGQRGKSMTDVVQTGFASLERFRTVITQPNFGQNFSMTGNSAGGGFAASTGTCTSGLNMFDPASISADCFEAIGADIKTKATMTQTIWEANTQGSLFQLPAGSIQASLGASYRENVYDFRNDTLTSQGRSFLDSAIGLQPSGNSAGRIVAKEVYGELLIPVLSDLPAIERLEFNLGLRYSDYNTTGGSWTYKFEGTWKATNWLHFRGGYNRAERAPNIAELYLAPEQTFSVAPGGDVCSTRNGLSYSANPDVNSNYQQAIALCGALMEASGDPSADDQYYGVDYRQLTSASPAQVRTLVTQPQAAGAAFVFPRLVGNLNLTTEKADTWTAGVVIDSPFTSPLLAGLRLSIDYYNISVKDAIGAQTVDIVQKQCFDPAFNPNGDPANQYCSGVQRNQTGALGNVLQTFYNNGRFRTSGIDFQLDWSGDVGPGRLTVNTLLSYLLTMKSAELTTDPLVDYAGSQGPGSNGLNGDSYRYKLLTTVGYTINDLYLGIQWRHLPSIASQTSVLVPTTTATGVPVSYDLFNLEGRYSLTKDFRLRFGVENLFNRAPPYAGVNPGAVLPALPGGSFDAQNYDTNGRRFYMGASIDF